MVCGAVCSKKCSSHSGLSSNSLTGMCFQPEEPHYQAAELWLEQAFRWNPLPFRISETLKKQPIFEANKKTTNQKKTTSSNISTWTVQNRTGTNRARHKKNKKEEIEKLKDTRMHWQRSYAYEANVSRKERSLKSLEPKKPFERQSLEHCSSCSSFSSRSFRKSRPDYVSRLAVVTL